jgi:hypothetical protein
MGRERTATDDTDVIAAPGVGMFRAALFGAMGRSAPVGRSQAGC